MKLKSALLVVTAAALLTPAATSAQWNAASDFSILQNPNGAWSYGYRTTLASTSLTPYPLSGVGQVSQAYWSTTTFAAPGVFKNVSNASAVYYGTVQMAAGQLASHPGPSGEFSILRFTAPSAGNYSLATTFSGVDFGGVGTSSDVQVLVDGVSYFGGLINGYGATQTFASVLALNVGSVVDFAVGFGSNGNWFDDSTGIDARIDAVTATPEPASIALFATGLLGIAAVTRRRRAARGSG